MRLACPGPKKGKKKKKKKGGIHMTLQLDGCHATANTVSNVLPSTARIQHLISSHLISSHLTL
jgi:hypothetical protein